MKKLTWTIKIQVDKKWVEDGFDLHRQNIHDTISVILPYAYGYEFRGQVLTTPPKKQIAKLQGYKTVRQYEEACGLRKPKKLEVVS